MTANTTRAYRPFMLDGGFRTPNIRWPGAKIDASKRASRDFNAARARELDTRRGMQSAPTPLRPPLAADPITGALVLRGVDTSDDHALIDCPCAMCSCGGAA